MCWLSRSRAGPHLRLRGVGPAGGGPGEEGLDNDRGRAEPPAAGHSAWGSHSPGRALEEGGSDSAAEGRCTDLWRPEGPRGVLGRGRLGCGSP